MADITIASGTPDGGPGAGAGEGGGVGTDAGETAGNAVSEPVMVPDAGTPPAAEPGSLFRPTMRDPEASASETGRTVPPRPMEEGGAIAAPDRPDPAADQVLVLGPSEPGDGAGLVPGAPDGAAVPPVTAADAAGLIDGTSLFGDRAATWSGDPSEVGAGYGVDPVPAEACQCGETELSAEAIPALGS